MIKRNCPHCKRVGRWSLENGLARCRTCYATSNLDAWKPVPHKPNGDACEVCHAKADLGNTTCDGPVALCSGPQVVVWGHDMPHEAVTIIANLDGLIALRDACIRALEEGRAGFMASPTDGESYMLRVALQEPLHPDLVVPYREPYYGWNPDAPQPGQMLPLEIGEGPKDLAFRIVHRPTAIVEVEPA